MLESLQKNAEKALSELQNVTDTTSLKEWRSQNLGKESVIMQTLGNLGGLPTSERPVIGRQANNIRQNLETAFQKRIDQLRDSASETLPTASLDVTLPGRPVQHGRLHIVTQTMRRIYAIWADMGFQIYRSPDVETDEYNFELLNIPKHHPARDMWDTFHTILQE